MTHECKFCGKRFNAAYFISKKEYTCGECSSYCMKKCPLASSTTMSWHRGPCVSCEHNPYKLRHTRGEKMNAEEERTYKHENYEWYKLHRICPRCRQYTVPKGYICCPNCRDQALLTYYKNMQSADYRAERKRKANEKRLERIRNGLCTRCGKPVLPADTYICCEECRKKKREYHKRKRKREKEDTTPIRILWLENGRCYFCGAPVVEGKKVCRKHYEGYPERAAKALAARDLTSHVWRKT